MSRRAGGGVDFGLARRWFWGLVVAAVLAMGALYRALAAKPGAIAGLAVLGSALLLVSATVQAARILRVLRPPVAGRGHGRRRGRPVDGPSRDGQGESGEPAIAQGC